MSHPNYPHSGPEANDSSQDVIYDYEQEQHVESDVDSDAVAPKRRKSKASSSSSQQHNHIRQTVANAQAAASAANTTSSSSEVTVSQRELQLATLVARNQRRAEKLQKRERELKELTKVLSQQSNRGKSSSSQQRGTESAAGGISDSDISNISDLDSDDGGNISDNSGGRGRRDGGTAGKDCTLRQLAALEFSRMRYVDMRVFTRKNLNVRRAKNLSSIETNSEFAAAWASYMSELHQYLISEGRGEDVVMVSKYHSQLVRLLHDFPTQLKHVKELDMYIRSAGRTVGGRVVWSVDDNDDQVSAFKSDIRYDHIEEIRKESTPAAPALPRLPPMPRRANVSSSSSSHRARSICFAYNGENKNREWTSESHCRYASKCQFVHKCMVCHASDHAAYQRSECASKRARPAAPRR
jgi:hypothetical protein